MCFIRNQFNFSSSFICSKLESRKFPSAMKITVPNVLGFILSNLNRPNRLTAIVSTLKYQTKQNQSTEKTLIALRREIEANIVESLRIWRHNSMKRSYTLKRIQELRRLYFTLFRYPENRDLDKLDSLVQNVLNVWLHDKALTHDNLSWR